MKCIQIFEALRSVWSQSHKQQFDFILNMIAQSENRSIDEQHFASIRAFLARSRERWGKCNRNKNIFYKKYEAWLEEDFHFQEIEKPQDTGRIGRPPAPFGTLSERSKERHTVSLRSSIETEQLLHAAASSLHVAGKRDEAKLLREVFHGSPERPKRVKMAWEEAKQVASNTSYSPEEALNLIVEAKLSKAQYKLITEGASKHNANSLYPSYSTVAEARRRCYPPPDSIQISESGAAVELQPLMNFTVDRLLLSLEPVLTSLTDEQLKTIVLVAKWGSDGSSGYSMFKQVSLDPNLNDSALYTTSVVPLQLFTLNTQGKKQVLWQNPRPSSPRYCRPVRFEFVKETQQHILHEASRVQEQIDNLQCHNTQDGSKREVIVSFRMYMTMVDGKLCNVLTSHKSTQSCYVCGATPSKMNDLGAVAKLKPNTETYKLGLSPLHAMIRSFEYFLHVGYRLEIRKWQCRTAQDKASVEGRKREIQRKFKEQLGLNVDLVKQGYGSSNDGNTARKFFNKYSESSDITGIDKSLIGRFRNILISINCGYEINIPQFSDYCLETARKCVELYGWYPMPPTIHKILIHGAAIIQSAPLPIGMMSEEALESRHKDCKHFRVFNTRKMSRLHCNEDMLHMCLITSDPVITSLRKLPQKNLAGPLPSDVLNLLREPDLSFCFHESSCSDSSSSEEAD